MLIFKVDNDIFILNDIFRHFGKRYWKHRKIKILAKGIKYYHNVKYYF